MIHFDIDKTIQAAAYLIKRRPGKTENYMRLLKLLYLADRESLKERGVPICGDAAYGMKEGPVPSRTLDLIKGRDPSSAKWEQFIERSDYDVILKSDPGNLHLSPAEINILDRVATCFKSFDPFDLVEWCHDNLPEYDENWKKRKEGEQSVRIPFEDVLSAIGRLDDQARIIAEINENAAFQRLFSHHMPASGTRE
jgi:uncharacterized phage-associated protein